MSSLVSIGLCRVLLLLATTAFWAPLCAAAGSHSLQESWGCEMQKNNRTRGFWDFYYDEEPFLSFHPVTHSWTVHPSSAQTLAMEVKKHWKSDDSPSKAQWAHVQGTICGRLQRYLNSWIAFNKTIGGRQFQLQRVQLRSSQVLNHQQMVKRNHNSTLQLASSFQGDAVEHICPEELEP
ncbi:MHC class I polypeptide-related sequence B isoform X6 [Marmota marmota marmota]|uniref:MHC class I polypeptide-related sequence B isoform X6 n=1 Tax=Marmota marmota marmota TaxID=9994 RepID=UPI002092EF9E|nr:MHC class I polypeptide-related sequence B isoform X6 [Marmota marmota marmota]